MDVSINGLNTRISQYLRSFHTPNGQYLQCLTAVLHHSQFITGIFRTLYWSYIGSWLLAMSSLIYSLHQESTAVLILCDEQGGCGNKYLGLILFLKFSERLKTICLELYWLTEYRRKLIVFYNNTHESNRSDLTYIKNIAFTNTDSFAKSQRGNDNKPNVISSFLQIKQYTT